MSRLDKLPTDWELVNLGKLGSFINGDRGKNYPSQEDFCNSGIPFINAGHIQDGNIDLDSMNYISEERFNLLGSGKIKPNDILYCLRGSLGKTAIVKGIDQGAIASSLVIIRPFDCVLTDYLYYFLTSSLGQSEILKYDNGSSQPNLSAKSVKEYTVPVPPLEEQRRIADILDKADAVRRKRKQAIALTEELLRSAFLDMFGDPVINPKGWEMVTVNDIVLAVRDGPHVSPEYSDSGIPILSTRNIRPSRLVMEDVKYVSNETYLKLVKQFKPQRGDVLLTKGGTTGFAKAVDWDWSFAIWVHLAALRPKSIIRPEFLEAALNSPSCYQQSLRYTHGIANKDLGLTRIRKIQLSLPPIHLQDKYCLLRQKLLNQLSSQEKSLSDSEHLFNSLLQRAFRGEL